jgi:acyl-CoA synthetase (AMP-forming)/AMP-acid ligase II
LQFNLADLFERVADAVPEREAAVCAEERRTYAQLDERATRLAHVLIDRGARPGSHVALYLRNSIEHLEAMFACYKARAVPININYRYVDDELEYLLEDADAVGIVHDADVRERATRVAARRTPSCFFIDVDDASLTTALDSVSPARDFDERDPGDHYVLYTGGTTGMPKGVVWRHEDIFFGAMGGGNPGGPPIARPDDIAVSVVENPAQRLRPFLPHGDPGPPQFVSLALGPLMHASGQWSAIGTLLGGGKVVLYDRPHVEMKHVLDLIERERVNAMNLVGDASARPLLAALARANARWDTSSLRLLGSGGSILSADAKTALLVALPSVLAIVEGIGSSESPAQAVAVTTRSGTPAGVSLTFAAKAETMVVDDELRPVARGSGVVGRLATRGRVPLGYYKDPDRSDRTFVEIDGERWSLPGDMATIDADGTVHLLGRGSLCINTGGEKVYPEEVEAVLKGHPGVADAVVIGAPDERFGQRVVAVVAPLDGAAPPDLPSLQAHCREQLAGYKVPRALFTVAAVERTAAGKPDYTWARDVAANAAAPG